MFVENIYTTIPLTSGSRSPLANIGRIAPYSLVYVYTIVYDY